MTASRPRILVVDDLPMVHALLAEVLGPHGFEVTAVTDGHAALARVAEAPPDAMILDLMLPGLNGLETLERLRDVAPQVPVIMLTAYADIPTAVKATQLGAYHYLAKPFRHNDLVLLVQRAVEYHRLLIQVEALRDQLALRGSLTNLMGPSPQAERVVREVARVAASPLTVLLQGETGTGKELVARALHQMSPQPDKPFLALDCGAIPEGLVESELFGFERGAFTGAHRTREGYFRLAEGGTLFLDEIANLSLAAQAKLLRVLQEKQVFPLGGKQPVPVSVRVLAASNVPLEREVEGGRFRQDLYYRVTEFVISLPPLRERRDDILYLAKLFLAEVAMELVRPLRGTSEAAGQALLAHSWPGNVRELRNVMRRAFVVSSGFITPEHLGGLGPGMAQDEAAGIRGRDGRASGRSLKEAREASAAAGEQEAIRHALLTARGNKTEAARLLKTDFKTLHLKMRRYGIHAGEFQRP